MTGITATSNRLIVEANTNVATANQAFNTSIHNFLQKGQVIQANVTPALVPASLASSVSAVMGLGTVQLHTYARFARLPQAYAQSAARKTAAHRAINGRLSRMNSGTAPAGCTNTSWIAIATGLPVPASPGTSAIPACYPAAYTPLAYRQAYDDEGNPTGQNVAIGDITISCVGTLGQTAGDGCLDDVTTDLWAMDRQNGLPTTSVRVVPVDGAPTSTNSGEAEWDVDTQSAVGLAGGVRQMVLYNLAANSITEIPLAISAFNSDNGVELLNISLGACEALWAATGAMSTTDFALVQSVLEGKTVTVASGDTGSFCPPPVVPSANAASEGVPDLGYPSTSPYATSVGGTSLFSSPNDGSYVTETSWNAGSGGMSYFEPESPWQSAMMENQVGAQVNRLVPDVAMAADLASGMYTYISGVPNAVGGTSLAAPIVEGIYARIVSDHSYFGNATPLFYQLYTGAGGGPAAGMFNAQTTTPIAPNGVTPANVGGFHDVYAGDNGFFQAMPGYDLNTGLGSLDINKLFIEFGS